MTRSLGPTPPAPVRDTDSAPWWDALGDHRVAVQRCVDCARWRWPARTLCSSCGSVEATWTTTSGRGTIASWIVNHHGFGPGFETPYLVVSVRLDEQDDLLVIGGFDGDPDLLRIDAPVEAVFIDHRPADDDPFTLLSWRPRPT